MATPVGPVGKNVQLNKAKRIATMADAIRPAKSDRLVRVNRRRQPHILEKRQAKPGQWHNLVFVGQRTVRESKENPSEASYKNKAQWQCVRLGQTPPYLLPSWKSYQSPQFRHTQSLNKQKTGAPTLNVDAPGHRATSGRDTTYSLLCSLRENPRDYCFICFSTTPETAPPPSGEMLDKNPNSQERRLPTVRLGKSSSRIHSSIRFSNSKRLGCAHTVILPIVHTDVNQFAEIAPTDPT